jgi:hypothetical protein
MAHIVECLPKMRKALSSNASTTKVQEEEESGDRNYKEIKEELCVQLLWREGVKGSGVSTVPSHDWCEDKWVISRNMRGKESAVRHRERMETVGPTPSPDLEVSFKVQPGAAVSCKTHSAQGGPALPCPLFFPSHKKPRRPECTHTAPFHHSAEVPPHKP